MKAFLSGFFRPFYFRTGSLNLQGELVGDGERLTWVGTGEEGRLLLGYLEVQIFPSI